ncbi:haloacid dehalogenase type II [Bacteroidota bacterium]
MNWKQYKCLSFDCYGTLVDWETGLLSSLNNIIKAHGLNISDNTLLEAYAEFESEIEKETFIPYKEVLAKVLFKFGKRFNFLPASDELKTFSVSVRNWLPFPDSVGALKVLRKKYNLVILSNIDDDLFHYSEKHLRTKFDKVFTAQQIGSYKPSIRNFYYLIENAGVQKKEILHIAQSLFHDIKPAKEVGLSTVWVNRRKGQDGFGATPSGKAQPDLEVSDLRTLATLVD